MIICKEMSKLRQYLDNKGIKWKDKSIEVPHLWVCETRFEINNCIWSVKNGYGTLGGWKMIEEFNENLLELKTNAVNNGYLVGYLTADYVIGYIEELKAGGKNE